MKEMDITQSNYIVPQNEKGIYEDNLFCEIDCNSLEIPENPEESQSSYGEVRSARLEFEEICQSIDEEEKRLQNLEDRRKKLELDMERLQEEIEKEKLLFRQAIDEELARNREIESSPCDFISEKFYYQPKIDPLNVNQDEVESKLKEYREAIAESQAQPTRAYEGDEEIKRLKSNLATYKKVLGDSSKEKIVKQKRKAAAKVFQKHLDEVELKCTAQIGKLATIQKSIENIVAPGETTNSNFAKSE